MSDDLESESSHSQHGQACEDGPVSESTQNLLRKIYFSDGPSPVESLPDDDPSTTLLRPSPRVRFRSRVRITSALHHHRHKWSRSLDMESDVPRCPSLSSSRSSSPSSSISAPLRSHPHGNSDSSSTWGPLGQRVGHFMSRRRAARDRETVDGGASPLSHGYAYLNERTPLASSPVRPSYVDAQERDAFDSEEDNMENIRLSREIDLFFGKWPGRLLNYRWWWWQLEPVFYCHCVDDSDMYD